MNKTTENLEEIKLVGVSMRTSNMLEMDPSTAIIGKTVGGYFSNGVANKIQGRVSPGKTYCVYTNYVSDENGEYTYFVGEEVESFNDVDSELMTLTIPQQKYTKFEVGPGSMPAVCINAWQNIWQMSAGDLGGSRGYIADFEIYDERAVDSANTCLDIYIGIK